MGPIQKAISDIKYRIPRAILEKVFVKRNYDWRTTVSSNIDEQIMTTVVKPRVLVDCNLIGGTQAMVPLQGLFFDKPNSNTTVVHIPKNRTQGRSINSVLHVAFLSQSAMASYASLSGVGGNGQYNSGENSALMGATVGMMSAMDKIPITSTANVSLISENTIMIKDAITMPDNCFLRCILSNDENLNDIQVRSYLMFSKLLEYAVKSYIYNELIIEVDVAEIQGGQALGVFKTVLESYSDSEQNYQDFLREKWEAVAFMNDAPTYARLIKLTLGGNR